MIAKNGIAACATGSAKTQAPLSRWAPWFRPRRRLAATAPIGRQPGQIRRSPRLAPRLGAVWHCDAGKHCLMCAVRIPIRASTARTATWRSGYATVCKTVYPGSIPGVASSLRSRSERRLPRRSVAKAGRASRRELRLGKPDWGGEAEKRAFAAFNAGRALLYAPHSHEQAIPR